MKLAKIREDLYLNPCNITSIEFDDEYNTTLITMVNGDVFSLKLPTKKALDAIYGSEETVAGSKLYQVSISTRCSTFTTQHVTAEQAFKYLRDLKNDQTLTINTMIETKSPLRQ